MRALQALDGALAGASQRRIATVLFGEEDVAARWSPDGELRAQVRYLIQRGRAMMEGEYRSLLASARGGAFARADSPCNAVRRSPRLPATGSAATAVAGARRHGFDRDRGQ